MTTKDKTSNKETYQKQMFCKKNLKFPICLWVMPFTSYSLIKESANLGMYGKDITR